MAQLYTNGFDIVVEISEQELNDQLAIQYINGELPQEAERSQTFSGNTVEIKFLFDTPSIDLSSATQNGINILMPFSYSSIESTGACTAKAELIAGEIQIKDQLSVLRDGNLRRVRVDFVGGIDDVQINFTPETEALLNTAFNPCGITVTQIRMFMAQAVRDFLQNDIQELVLDERTVDPTDERPFTITELDACVINDSSRIDGDCLAYLLSTSSTTSGDPSAFTQCMIPSGERVVIIISSDLLLRRVIRPELAAALGLLESDFNSPCELSEPKTIQGVRLETLRAFISNGHIKIRGTFSKSGTGYNATGSFETRIFLELQNGTIVTRTEQDEPDVEVDVAWWIYLVGAFLAGVLFGPLASVIALIVIGVVDAVTDGLAAGMLDELLSENLSGISGTPLPIGPIAEGLELNSITLDDLLIVGSPIRDQEISIRSEGIVELWPGQSLDLDTGNIHTPQNILGNRGFFFGEEGMMATYDDIAWGETYMGDGIWPQGIAHIKALTGRSFPLLSPIEIEHSFSYWEDVISYNNDGFIPSDRIPFGIVGTQGMFMLGVRAGSGRYAKCEVWRDLYSPKLFVRYVTYYHGSINITHPTDYKPGVSIFEAFPELETMSRILERREEEEEYYISRDDLNAVEEMEEKWRGDDDED